jgi:hypothetical protein
MPAGPYTRALTNRDKESADLKRQASSRLKEPSHKVGLSQIEFAKMFDLKYYTFFSQTENGDGGNGHSVTLHS